MNTSSQVADRKTAKFQKNLTKKASTTAKKGNDNPFGAVVIGFFIFVIIGSLLFQIIRRVTRGGMA